MWLFLFWVITRLGGGRTTWPVPKALRHFGTTIDDMKILIKFNISHRKDRVGAPGLARYGCDIKMKLKHYRSNCHRFRETYTNPFHKKGKKERMKDEKRKGIERKKGRVWKERKNE